jgi:hypothetical protein
MPYSKDLKVFWFLPMRSATRSCRPILNKFNFLDGHLHNFINDFEHQDYYLIANVRNPYSRLVSIYLHSIIIKQISDKVRFDVWIKKRIPHELNPPFNLESKSYLYLTSAFKYKKPDYYVRFESLEEDLKNIWFVKENYDEKMEILFNENILSNKYKSEEKPWQSYYTQELADFAYDNLKEDFISLNYNKDSWKDGTS